MRKFLIIIEKRADGFGAYLPDVPGCVAVGATREKVGEKMVEAVQFHLEGLKEDGIRLPESESYAEYVILLAAV